MKIAFYDTHSYDKEAFTLENQNYNYEIEFFDFKLSPIYEETHLFYKEYNVKKGEELHIHLLW